MGPITTAEIVSIISGTTIFKELTSEGKNSIKGLIKGKIKKTKEQKELQAALDNILERERLRIQPLDSKYDFAGLCEYLCVFFPEHLRKFLTSDGKDRRDIYREMERQTLLYAKPATGDKNSIESVLEIMKKAVAAFYGYYRSSIARDDLIVLGELSQDIFDATNLVITNSNSKIAYLVERINELQRQIEQIMNASVPAVPTGQNIENVPDANNDAIILDEKKDLPVCRKKYIETLWTNHLMGSDHRSIKASKGRELIEYYVSPSIVSPDGDTVSAPFSDSHFSKLIMASSGLGKTTLLDIILLSSIEKEIQIGDSPFSNQITAEKHNAYQFIRNALFGNDGTSFLPVFIHANSANDQSYESALELAEGYDCEGFIDIVQEANREVSLLFLIDAIDEVESEKRSVFLSSIKQLLKEYERANSVLTSRFLGSRQLPFKYDLLHLKDLEFGEIQKITHAVLSKEEADIVITRMKNEADYLELSKNPFMLMTILGFKGELLVHQLLKTIIIGIINQRWAKHFYKIQKEEIMLLLGFLACQFVFDNMERADLVEIRKCFVKADDTLKLHGLPYNVPIENIDYFLHTLSCQSGILNVTFSHEDGETYFFQDKLVMYWLASNYIINSMDESTAMHDREGQRGIWANMYWLDTFIRSFSSKDEYLSIHAVNVLAMVLVMCSEDYGVDIQKSILYYLICRHATSLCEQEQRNLVSSYNLLLSNSFGENDITNLPDGEAVQLIKRLCTLSPETVL